MSDDSVFFSNGIAIHHNNKYFFFEFKQSSPRLVQEKSKTGVQITTKSETVMIDAYFAKVFLNLLKENLSKYEKKYGKIKLAVPKKKKKKETVATTAVTPATKYIG